MPDADPRDERIAQLEHENALLRQQNGELAKKVDELVRRVEKLEKEIRRQKRQATPFAREKSAANPRKPGRPAGHPGAHRGKPDHVDEEVFAPLERCPCCGGEVIGMWMSSSSCSTCPRFERSYSASSRSAAGAEAAGAAFAAPHPAQVSTAGGAAVTLGPRALGLAAELKHRLGVPYRKVVDLFATYFGMRVRHSAFVHASVRLSRLGEPTSRDLFSR